VSSTVRACGRRPWSYVVLILIAVQLVVEGACGSYDAEKSS